MRLFTILLFVLVSVSLNAQTTERNFTKRFSTKIDTINVKALGDKVEVIRTTKDFAELKISVEVASSEEVADALKEVGAFDIIQHTTTNQSGHKKATINESPTAKRIPVGIEVNKKYKLFVPADKAVVQ